MEMTIFSLIVLLFSTIIHEVAHASVAYHLGDPTAKYEGRLTLNPLKHLDPIGSILVPLFTYLTLGRAFGWAKPVPINPYNFKDQKWGEIKVALAGPLTNFTVAIVFGLMVKTSITLAPFFIIISFYNFSWAIFNLIPVPPLDGHWFLFRFLPDRFYKVKEFLTRYGSLILLILVFYGLDWVFLLSEKLLTLIIY